MTGMEMGSTLEDDGDSRNLLRPPHALIDKEVEAGSTGGGL